MTELILASQPSDLAQEAAEWLSREVSGAISERGRCALCLAGGRTPEPVYRALASGSAVDWNRVDVYFGDERAVPPDHPDSNYHMVYEALLSRVPVPPDQVHRMEAERDDRDAAALDYERRLPPRLDVLFLGMGQDGHTASLFPGSVALDERQRRVVPVIGAKPPAGRLTITPPVISAARSVAVVATGDDKAAMVAHALEGPLDPKSVPVQLARRGVWFLDHAAASSLTSPKVAR
jgi:6-phosphogluconolactonase